MAEALFRYKRVVAYPGKHGGRDMRVEFSGGAPTHGETAAMAALKCMAEDRYLPAGKGRQYFVENVLEPAAMVDCFAHVEQLAVRLDAKLDKR